jgi:AP-1-like factor
MSPNSVGGSNHASPSSQISNVNPAFTSYSTNTNMHGFASTLPQMNNNNNNDPFGDLFSPSILKSASVDSGSNYFNNAASAKNLANGNDVSGGDSTAGLNRVFQFNSNASTSDSTSPSASSASQWNANANSSCETSPEPSHDSPANKPKNAETFCDKINPNNNNLSDTTLNRSPLNNFTNISNNDQFNTGAYNISSLDTFDPVLFGDYRDNSDSLLGGGDFTSGFFDEAINPGPFDIGSPSNLFGILQSPQQTNASLGMPNGAANAPTPSKNLMAEMDKARDGGDDDYGLPNMQASKFEGSGKLISCNNIW